MGRQVGLVIPLGVMAVAASLVVGPAWGESSEQIPQRIFPVRPDKGREVLLCGPLTMFWEIACFAVACLPVADNRRAALHHVAGHLASRIQESAASQLPLLKEVLLHLVDTSPEKYRSSAATSHA